MQEITEAVAKKVLEVVDAGLCSGKGVPKPGKMCVEAAVCYALDLPHDDDPQCVSRALRSLKIHLNDSNWSSNEARGRGLRRLALIQLGSRDALDDKEFVRRVTDLVMTKQVPAALRVAAAVHKDEKHKAELCKAANRLEKEKTREAAENARVVARDAFDAAADRNAEAAAADAKSAAASAADAAAYAFDAAAAYAFDAAAFAVASAADRNAEAADALYRAAKKVRAATRDEILSEFAEDVVQILIDMKVPGTQWLALTELAA
jgi:hypothetical protein